MALTAQMDKVYPRVCGGTYRRARQRRACRGLSPRVRGNLRMLTPQSRQVGSIPACAGEPGHSHQHLPIDRVYPRVCGGTGNGQAGGNRSGGLSPRVRGNRVAAVPPSPAQWSIPACAGEPLRCLLAGRDRRVYPRVCGGTTMLAVSSPMLAGLSPRVRGNPRGATSGGHGARSIPACAGEPREIDAGHCDSPVYPRVCGGTTDLTVTMRAMMGLSPRVRGNLMPRGGGRMWGGSIPACAGEPPYTVIKRSLIMVYPRVCGGTHVSRQ